MPSRELRRDLDVLSLTLGTGFALQLLTGTEAIVFMHMLLVSAYRLPQFPVYALFSLDSYSDVQCWALFRFERNDLQRLRVALRIPDVVHTRNGTVCPGLEALCVVLSRLSYPSRWTQLLPMFGHSITHLSQVFNEK